jgi:ketosteroid isomerase-like protein
MNFMDEGSGFGMELQYRNFPEDEKITAKNRKILLDAFDKLAAGDVDAWWAIYDPDVVFHEAACLPYGGAHKGIEAVKEAVARLVGMYASMHAIFERIFVAGDMAIAYQTITFRVKGNGNTGTMPVAELYRFRNGKVVEWRALYFDSNQVAQSFTGAAANA